MNFNIILPGSLKTVSLFKFFQIKWYMHSLLLSFVPDASPILTFLISSP
jgi:hypothetical protein